MSVFTPLGRTGRTSPCLWLTWVLALGLFACDASVPPASPIRRTEPKGTSLYLEVKSVEGDVVPEAQVKLASGQRQKVNPEGKVLLQQLPKGPQFLQVEAEGYFPTAVAFKMDEGVQAGARLRLFPLGEPVRVFDASTGDKVPSGDIEFIIPPGALFDANNQPIQGRVEVFIATLDLEEGELRLAPGALEGVLGVGGVRVPLESFGLVSLVFTNEGRIVPYARGIGVRGRVPGSVRASSLREGMKVVAWRPESGGAGWVPTGDTGQLEQVAPGTFEWALTVEHQLPPVLNVALPYWWHSESADAEDPLKPTTPPWAETACLEVRVVDGAGQPVAGLAVEAQGEKYSGLSRALTDAEGRALLEVMRERDIQVDVGTGPQSVGRVSDMGTCVPGEGAAPRSVTLTVPARTCTAGAERDCASGLTRGICRPAHQTCDVDGLMWSVCGGEVAPQAERCDTPLDENCDGSVNESCTRTCDEGTTRSCYGGPTDTKGIGVCREGFQTCVAGGTAWTEECEGQRQPDAWEDYSRPGDENCDGVSSLCQPGTKETCPYEGPAGTEGKGRCRAGTRTCNALGTDWEACTGEVRPLPEELCTTQEDDDCDGEVNEGTVCACEPNVTEPCYTGPVGTRNVGACHGGTRACNAEGTGWSACMGEVVPQPDTCFNNIDDDCNNVAPVCAWSQGVVMNTARFRHQAVLLPAGKVLVVGGSDGTNIQSTAEVYDPDARTWTQTSTPMSTARQDFAMTLLPDGKVLVAGGFDGQALVNSAELYNPDSGTWVTTSPMSRARQKHAMTLLSNGKVLVTGGEDGVDLTSAEVYDPATGTWSSTGSMQTARKLHSTTRLGNGQVLVTGGTEGGHGPTAPFSSLASAELYDPVAGTWSTTESMGTQRAYHSATLLNDGKVLVAGGENGGRDNVTFLASAELYDPATGTWSATASMHAPRTNNTRAVMKLDNGRVLVVGGYGPGAADTAEVYDPVARTWETTPSLNTPRGEHAAVLLANGEVLICGGSLNGVFNSVELHPR